MALQSCQSTGHLSISTALNILHQSIFGGSTKYIDEGALQVTRSKLSCLAWNRYLSAQLVSSDYEGVATLWDTEVGQAVSEYEAHDKRIWSVDFCPSDAQLFLSGSDDGFVKVCPYLGLGSGSCCL